MLAKEINSWSSYLNEMKTIDKNKYLSVSFLLLIFYLLIHVTASAQTPVSELSVPTQNMINEEICFSISINNQGQTGYQPYLRVFLPPEINIENMQINFMDQPILNWQDLGVFSGGVIEDPNIDDAWPEMNVSGPTGYRFILVNLPVGSVVEGGVTLAISICAELNGLGVTVNEAVEVFTTTVYRFGDTALGTNGPIVEEQMSGSVIPTLYLLSKSVNESSSPVGSCWPIEYTIKVNIADQEVVTDLEIIDLLPPDIQYISLMSVTPGCVVQEEPSTSLSGGDLRVTCATAAGTIDSEDVVIAFSAFLTDQLDPNQCDSLQYNNACTAEANEGSQLGSSVTTRGRHFGFGVTGGGGEISPGLVSNVNLEFGISEFVDGIDEMTLQIVVPDGMQYLGNASLNGTPINPSNILGPVNGVTSIDFDVHAENGSDFNPCETGIIAFDVLMLENYDNGDAILSRDSFTITNEIIYSITNGVEDCVSNADATYGIQSVETVKEVISSPSNGESYAPGETVTYRLSMIIPSEDVGNIVFEDLFPIPIHDISTLDLNFGNDITLSPTDNAGLTPQGITIDEDKNSLFIDWGGVSSSTTGVPTVISVDIDIEISTEPFADGLTHSNFARFHSDNSLLDGAVSLNLTSIFVGSPDLEIHKGIAGSNNPRTVLAPIYWPNNANANYVDAYDYLDYEITLVNVGNAAAYDIIVNDIPPVGWLTNCTFTNVTNGIGDDVNYTGNLFTTGLVVESIEKTGAADDADVAVISYTCQVESDVYVHTTFTNTASATWVAAPGSPNYYDPISEVANVTMDRPIPETELIEKLPGYASEDKMHVGEFALLKTEIRIPEGRIAEANIEIILDEGLAFESLDSLKTPFNLTFSIGSSSEVMDNAIIENIGSGTENEHRKLILSFDEVSNTSGNNNIDELITLYYKVAVLNAEVDENLAELDNVVNVNYVRGDYVGWYTALDTTSFSVVEPDLVSTITYLSDELSPGEETLATLTIGHSPTSTATAFDISLINDLPLGLSFVDDSFELECIDLFSEMPSEAFGSVTAAWDSLPLGVTCEIVFQVKVLDTYPPCTVIDNCSELLWTSTYDADMVLLDVMPMNALAVERTGDTTNVGGISNDYLKMACSSIEIINSQTTTPIISGEEEACLGSDLTLSIPEYNGLNIIYHWDGPGVPLGFNQNELTLSDVDEDIAGDYTVYVQIGDCFTDISVPLNIEVYDNPVVDLPDIDIPCANGVDDIIINPILMGGEGPFEYFWIGPNSYQSSDPNASIPNAGEEDEGVYTLYVIDSHDCSSNSATSTVAVANAPETPEISQPEDICEGGTIELTCTSFAGDVTYFWDTPDGIVETSTPSLVILETTSADNGNYSVWADVNTCITSLSAETNIQVESTPETPDVQSNDISICEGETLTLWTESEAEEYFWTGPNGYESILESPPVISDISSFEAGEYSLVISNGGCDSEGGTINISVLPKPDTPMFDSNAPLCEGETLELMSNDSANEYLWLTPSGNTFITSEGNLSISSVNAGDEGNYSLAVSDGLCTSDASAIESIIVDVIPEVSAFAGDDVFICPETNPMVEAGNDEEYSGFWTSENESISIVNPESFESLVLGTEEEESYVLYWSLFNEGCGVYSTDSMNLIAPESPLADLDEYTTDEGESLDMLVLSNDHFEGYYIDITIEEEPLHGSTEIGLNEYVVYTPDDSYSGEDEFIYSICLVSCPSLCDTTLVKVFIEPHLEIPDVITPNGDGSNDTFVINGVDNFPQNEIYIYNRWGKEIYHSVNYQNDWDGTWEGKPLPESTYFYVFIETGLNEPVAQGYITLHR